MPVWTPDLVGDALLAAYRQPAGALPPSPGEIERRLNWRRRFLAADPRGWSYLMASPLPDPDQ